jgi:hypothetical protein
MRKRSTRGQDRLVPDRVLIRLELETGEPIRGHLVDELGDAHAFEGWLELNSAIQAACQGAATEPEIGSRASEMKGDGTGW